jgi:prefoldin subunit 5
MSEAPSVPPDLMSLLQQHDDFAEEMTRTLMAISERIKRLEERIETLEGGTST